MMLNNIDEHTIFFFLLHDYLLIEAVLVFYCSYISCGRYSMIFPVAHTLHLLFYGASRLGSRGNMDDFRMFFNPKYNITTRSSPIPPPAWGKAPCLKAST